MFHDVSSLFAVNFHLYYFTKSIELLKIDCKISCVANVCDDLRISLMRTCILKDHCYDSQKKLIMQKEKKRRYLLQLKKKKPQRIDKPKKKSLNETLFSS